MLDPCTLTIVLAVGGKVAGSLMDHVVNPAMEAIVGGVLGNRADWLVCEKGGAFLRNLQRTDPVLNHDLERATREAYLVATLELVRQAEARNAVGSAGSQLLRAGADTALVKLRAGIEADLKNAANTLPEPLADAELFLLDPAKAPDARLLAMRATLRTNLDRDAARWLHEETMPEVIETLLDKGWTIDTRFRKNVARDWQSLIALAFVEKLKSDTRLSSVFEARLLAEMAVREPQVAPMATFAGFAAQLEQLAPGLQPIEDSLGAILQGIEKIQHGVDAANERLLDVGEGIRIANQQLEELPGKVVAELVRQFALGAGIGSGLATPFENEQAKRLEQRELELREVRDDLALTQRQHTDVSAQLREVTAEREALVQSLLARDRAYAAEVAEYGRQMAGVAERGGPEMVALLQRFADGDRLGAMPVIEKTKRAAMAARARAAAVRNAEELREIGALKMIMRDRGELSSAELLTAWEEAQQLDPSCQWGWVELGRLYMDLGRLPSALQAAESALSTASVAWERSVGLNELGDVLVAAGELGQARERFTEALAIKERLAKENPTNTDMQREVAVSLNKLGEALLAAGEMSGAKERFTQALAITQALVKTTSEEGQRDVSVCLNRLGSLLVAAGELGEARERFTQALAIRKSLAKANPVSAEAQRDVSVSLNKLGDVLLAAGELAEARERFTEALAIAERLAEANPASAAAKRDLSVCMDKLGNLLLAMGDSNAAKERFVQALAIDEGLAQANPASAEAQRDVSVGLERLGDVLVTAGALDEAKKRLTHSLAIRQSLAMANPASAAAQRDLSVGLERLGNLLVATGELHEARERFTHALTIAERLALVNSSSAEAQRDVAVNLNRLGDLLLATGELDQARERFIQALAIADRLSKANPTSAEAQRDRIVSNSKLGHLTGDLEFWRKALAVTIELNTSGRLAPRDSWMLRYLKEKADNA